MNNGLTEFIYKRKSVRKYTAETLDGQTLEKIESFLPTVTPLYPHIKTEMRILPREQVHCFFKWMPKHALALYSEETDGHLENAGFILQQAELYLQALGLGVCWLGLAKQKTTTTNLDGLKFVILLGFGYPDEEQFRTAKDFKRKPLFEISDSSDTRLECARLAPSSMNSQPWYFVHDNETVHTYCSKTGLLRMVALGNFNRIDMGIALAHIALENENFRFFKAEKYPEVKGHYYIGSFTL